MNTQNCSTDPTRISALFRSADYVLIGAGAGLSASGGLDYGSPELFARLFPDLKKRGIQTIGEAISIFWSASDRNRRSFWAYWARHIQHIRYDAPAAEVYEDLHALVAGRNYFVITTNADGQFLKAGFDRERLFSPQGDYRLFQCKKPCSDNLYDNREMVGCMIAHTDSVAFQVDESSIPLCPRCGGYMERNLRADDAFVEAPHMVAQKDYLTFIDRSKSGRLLLLELGVGFNTPAIIRWPFEAMAARHPDAMLIRMNRHDPQVSPAAAPRTLCVTEDIAKSLGELRSCISGVD